MPKQLTSLAVFVSGPSDVEAEKARLRTVTTDIGQVLEKTHGVTLRLIGWPDTFHPGIGIDPQSVISQQLGNDYDIYVGILGIRFGHPTTRASSGTEEEFSRYWIASVGTPHQSECCSTLSEQKRTLLRLILSRLVRRFRDELGVLGVLYKDFKDTAQFTELTRKDLHHLIVDEWKNGQWNQIEISSRETTIGAEENQEKHISDKASEVKDSLFSGKVATDDSEEEKLGLLGLVEEFSSSAQSVSEIISRVWRAHNIIRAAIGRADRRGQ